MPIRLSDDLLTTAEAADILNRPIGSVNRWAKEGVLPVAVKLPKRTGANLFRREDVEALAEKKKPKAIAGETSAA